MAALRNGLHGEIGVGEEPVEHTGLNRSALLAEFERRLQAKEGLLKIMIEAEPFACQGYRNALAASSHPTGMTCTLHFGTHVPLKGKQVF